MQYKLTHDLLWCGGNGWCEGKYSREGGKEGGEKEYEEDGNVGVGVGGTLKELTGDAELFLLS